MRFATKTKANKDLRERSREREHLCMWGDHEQAFLLILDCCESNRQYTHTHSLTGVIEFSDNRLEQATSSRTFLSQGDKSNQQQQ